MIVLIVQQFTLLYPGIRTPLKFDEQYVPQNLEILLGSLKVKYSLAKYTCEYEQTSQCLFQHMLEKMESNRSLGLTVWMNLLHITFLSPLQKNINKNYYQQHYTFWSPYWLYSLV